MMTIRSVSTDESAHSTIHAPVEASITMKRHGDRPQGGSHRTTSGPGFGGLLRSLFARIPWGEMQSEEETLIIDAPPGRAIRIRNANGKTRVVGEDREDIEIRITKSVRADCPDAAAKLLESIRLQNLATGDELEIEVQIPRKCSRHGIAHLELHVPRDTSVALSSTNGKICLEGLDRAIRARSSNGSVSICEVNGDIDVTTANAKVACRCTHGHLRARSSNGKIEVGGHHGSVDASTSNGVIKASIDALGETGVTLTTSNGRIALELPDHPDADVDIHVENGLIRNDLEFEEEVGDANDRVQGRVGKGGPPIRLRTSNGTVSLR
ncbi:MAG: DUF4097 domain-containing protein [bacterium]|nr:DUF4097 domain-containing protein [bacterium]